jgi:transcriptional regulator
MAITTISINKELKEKLAEFGNAGETMPQIIEKLLKSANERLFHDFIMGQDSIPIEDVLNEFENKYGN